MDPNQASFSLDSAQYSLYRPRSPRALYEFLASITPSRQAALDCGTGNGQAAVSLAEFFETIVAIDISAEQLAVAEPHPRVEYRNIAAEALDYPEHSFDIVTVATALHWFDLDVFFPAVKRMLKPEGVLAVWGYGSIVVPPEVEAVLRVKLYPQIGPYWGSGNQIVAQGYRTIQFPFREHEAPRFTIELDWGLDQLLGYLSTWSAVKRYDADQNEAILPQVREDLLGFWADGESRRIEMPLALRVGTV